MDSRKHTYFDLLKDLNELLAPHMINPVVSDIFAETLLKVAGVETVPTRCEILPDREDHSRLLMNIDGISRNDADTFKTYLIVTDGTNPFSDLSESGSEADAENEEDSSELFHDSFESTTESTEEMTVSTISDETSIPSTPSTPSTSYDDEEASVADESQPDYQFSISVEHARQFLLPIFKRNLELMTEEQIEQYQVRSFEDLDSYLSDNILEDMLKLDRLYVEIIQSTLVLQSSSISKYTKGQLDIILNDMVIPPLEKYHNETKGHDCPPAISSLQAINNNILLYNKHVETDVNLSGHEAAKKLQADVSDYIKTAVEIIDLNEVRSVNQATASLVGLFGIQSKPKKTEQQPVSDKSDVEKFIESLLPTWKV